MTIFLNILFLLIGMVLLIKGADFFVDGASAVAKKLKVPTFIIGLTVVAIGTSLPELSVSLSSAIGGSSDLSVGNIVGSNLANILLILAVSSIICTTKVSPTTKSFEFPFLAITSGALLLFSADSIIKNRTNLLSRAESIILFAMFIFYLFIVIKNALKQRKATKEISVNEQTETSLEQAETAPTQSESTLSVWKIVIYLILGLAAVVFGGECVCSTSQFIALKLGMSEALVGLTIVAVGTSLPELVTSIVAARKQQNELALGNVIGSNIANICLILGLTGTIQPIVVSAAILTDILVMFVATLLLVIFASIKNKINRPFGFILLSMYILYLAFAIVRNYYF